MGICSQFFAPHGMTTIFFQDSPPVFEEGESGNLDDAAGHIDHHPAFHLPPPGDHLVTGLQPQLSISPSDHRHLVSPSSCPPAHETYHDGGKQQVQERCKKARQ